MKILAGLTRLRQLCCHPALFLEGYEGSSGKLEQLLELVEECRASGKRMLVFSQFTEMLGLIRRELEGRDIPYYYLDGSTPSARRLEMCDAFNGGDRDVFLISLKAGGTGLNLTGADTVVLFDLWWNPAVEQQAADRAHRIGQKKVVQVFKLVAQGTIEEKILELQQRKKDLIEEIVQPGESSLTTLTEEDIRELLNI
jgi:SNF2 family DNA or RNA helicase